MKLTKEERSKKVQKLREKRHKESIRLKKKEDFLKIKEYNSLKYPPTITTMIKRIKRMDPWNTVVSMNNYDSSMIVFFKLKQKGIDNVRIITTNNHSWVEFEFSDNWYIIDVSAIKNKEYGEPIKHVNDVKNEVYKKLKSTYTDIDDYIQNYEDKLSYDKDEAKIEAMQDSGLNTFLIIKYY
jgi:hypothetical protein